MRRRNRSLAAQNLPPEFKFSPTKMYYGEPPRNVIYEDVWSEGQAPIDATSERMLDPIRWQSGRSPMDNVRRGTQGVVSRLTHHLRHQGATKRTRMHKFQKETITTHIEEERGARAPRVKDRTPLEIARGAKLRKTYDPAPDLEQVLSITSGRRGFTPGSKRSYAALMSHMKSDVITTLAAQHQLADAKKEARRVRMGTGEFTPDQVASMPPGYIKEIIRRRKKRDAQAIRSRVRFDPRETKGRATHGEYTTMYRPGLVPVGDGKFVHPSSVHQGATYHSALMPSGFSGIGQASEVGAGDMKGALGIAGALLAGLAGIGLLMSAGTRGRTK